MSLSGVFLTVAVACGGCATPRQIAKLYSELNGARLDVEMVRSGDEVRADARVRNGWINRMTLWDPFGNSYRPTSVKAAPEESRPKFSVGVGGLFGGDRHHEGFEDSPSDDGHRVGIDVPVGSRDKSGDRKTFTFDVPEEDGPEHGGWQVSCDVTTREGNTPVFPFEVPATSTPEDPIYIDYSEKCECCPNLRLCVDIYIITDPGAAPGPQFSPLKDKVTLKRLDEMVSVASSVWEKACIYIEVCQVFVLDPKKIKIPGGGGKTLDDYMDADEVYSIKKTINGRDFLGAAGEYVKANKKKHHKCPFGNTNCLKLFIVNAGGPGGKHGGGSVVDMSQVVRPHPTALAHEFGHDMMGDVPGKTDGSGHTTDGKNLMFPKIDGAGKGIEDWQKKRAQDEIKRRGLQNPESEAKAKERADKICEEIKTLTGQIAAAEAAEAAKKPKPPPEKKKKKRRKRKKKSVKDQIDEIERRIKTNETARDNADDDVYRRAHQRAIDRLKAKLGPLKKRLPKPDKPEPAGGVKPPAAGVGKDFDLDKAKERLKKLKKELRRLACDGPEGKTI